MIINSIFKLPNVFILGLVVSTRATSAYHPLGEYISQDMLSLMKKIFPFQHGFLNFKQPEQSLTSLSSTLLLFPVDYYPEQQSSQQEKTNYDHTLSGHTHNSNEDAVVQNSDNIPRDNNTAIETGTAETFTGDNYCRTNVIPITNEIHLGVCLDLPTTS